MPFLIFLVVVAIFVPIVIKAKGKGKGIAISTGLVAFILATFLSAFAADFYVVVEPGEVAVYRDLFKGVLNRVDGTGMHFKLPIIQKAKKFVIQTQAYTMSIASEEGAVRGDDSLQAKTSDGQDVWVDVTMFFHITPDEAPRLWQTVGDEYVDKIIRPNARGEVRLVVSGYTAEGLYSAEQRADAQKKMEESLTPILADKGITLERVTLRNVIFTQEFSDAVEAKQVAYQQIQKAEYDLERKEIEKQQMIVEAEGEAEAIRLRGETLKANPAVIQYEFVQKMSPDIQWGVLPSGSIPLLDLNALINTNQ
ncbi:MAG TPA: prohibitin family protein [bacterium]|nr:prohibitin family protein [bacterium]